MFKVYRRGAARRAWRMGCRSHASSSPPALPPRQLGQSGFRKKHTHRQACEPPARASTGCLSNQIFLIWVLRSPGAKIWCKTPLSPCPASCPYARQASREGCVLGACSMLTHACAPLWPSFGPFVCVGWLLSPTYSLVWWHRRAEGQGLPPIFGRHCAEQGIAHRAGLPGPIGPCFLLELLHLLRILPLCIFSSFPPQGFQSNISICGSRSCGARFQLLARAVAGGAGEGDGCSARAPAVLLERGRVCTPACWGDSSQQNGAQPKYPFLGLLMWFAWGSVCLLIQLLH